MNNINEVSANLLPVDLCTGSLLARVWHQDSSGIEGPSPVLLKGDGVYELSNLAPTMSELIELPDLHEHLKATSFCRIGDINDVIANTVGGHKKQPYFLAPVDVQAVKACGVTFVCSMLERVIEEQAAGDAKKATQVREKLNATLDVDLSEIVPGS